MKLFWRNIYVYNGSCGLIAKGTVMWSVFHPTRRAARIASRRDAHGDRLLGVELCAVEDGKRPVIVCFYPVKGLDVYFYTGSSLV